MERALSAGVGFVISAGTTERSSERAIELSRAFQSIFAGVGVHPMDIGAQLTARRWTGWRPWRGPAKRFW